MGVGENIRLFRLMLGMTQEELAEKMGYKSKTTINKIEKEVNSMPLDKIQKFAEVLHTSPSVLLGEEESTQHVITEQMARINQAKRHSSYYNNLVDILNTMNDDGIKRLTQYAEDIQDKYKKGEDNAEEV